MRRILEIVKWMLVQIRPYMKKLILIFISSIMLSLCGVGMVIASKELIDIAVSGLWRKAFLSGIFLAGILLLQSVMKAIVSMMKVNTSQTMANKLRESLYLRLTEVEWTEFTKYHSGDIVTRLTNDVSIIVEGIVEELPEFISMGTGLVAAFITLFVFDHFLAVFALLLVPVAILMSHFIGKRFVNIQLKAKEAESRYRSYLQECIEHMLVLKTFCREKSSGERFSELQEESKRLVIRNNRTMIGVGSLITGGYWLSYFIVFGWGAMRLARKTTSFGTFTAFIQLVGQIQQPFMGLAQSLPQLLSMASSAKRLIELENLVKENPSELERGASIRSITFHEVSFEYEEGKQILSNITAKIYAGEIIGLIGASGEGKTTMIHLLLSLYHPLKGSIYIQNSQNECSNVSASLRNLISYIPQGNTLFSGTISDNLIIGNPNASEEEQIAALEGVDAWVFVSKLPLGLDTVIGERGQGLSEGQAQRIAIARALIRTTPILLLDEATSALDIESEQKVLQNIVQLSPRRTCIIITHRTSILEYCSRVWRLSQGKISEVNGFISEAAASEAI